LKNPIGAIDAAPSPPVYALALQFFRDAPHMLDLKVGPLTGATILTSAAWAKISPEDRAHVMAAAVRMEQDVNTTAGSLDANAIAEMTKAGLNIVTLDAKAEAEFRATAGRLAQSQRGTLVPADVFDAAVRERDAYRKTRK
jgi:TRAP-type C4-dicarboxylate transport system substrate-binding protein